MLPLNFKQLRQGSILATPVTQQISLRELVVSILTAKHSLFSSLGWPAQQGMVKLKDAIRFLASVKKSASPSL